MGRSAWEAEAVSGMGETGIGEVFLEEGMKEALALVALELGGKLKVA